MNTKNKILLKDIPEQPSINIEAILSNPDTIIKLATNWKQEKEKREQLEQQLQLQQPKIDTYNQFLKNPTEISVNAASKLLKVGRNTLFAHLRKHGVLTKENLPTARYVNKGYFKVQLVPTKKGNIPTTFVQSNTGLPFLRDFLKKYPIK